LAGEEHVEDKGDNHPSWCERFWSRFTRKRCSEESFDEEGKPGSGLPPASSDASGPAVFSDHESVPIGAPHKTELRHKVAENRVQEDVDGNHDRRGYWDDIGQPCLP